jgi:hypothetical protein
VSAAQVDAGFVARQAAALEEALGQVDTGAFARRGARGEAVSTRPAVADIDRRLFEARVGLLMWSLHGRCGTPGAPEWPLHAVEAHRADAEAGVRMLFPLSGFEVALLEVDARLAGA